MSLYDGVADCSWSDQIVKTPPAFNYQIENGGTMTVDENEFFRQATLRISSSLNIETAMKKCMDYLKQYIPISGMFFGVYSL